MKKIFIRSPYFIQVNEAGQLGSKVELYLYNKNSTIPIIPTYTLSKKIASNTQRENTYNISNYAKEFIKPIAPITVIVPTEENVNCWAYCIVKRYTELTLGVYTLLSTETFVCLNGYTNYIDGYNQNDNGDNTPLFNTDIKIYKQENVNGYVNVWLDDLSSAQWSLEKPDLTLSVIESTGSVYKIPYLQDGKYILYKQTNRLSEQFNFIVETICEPKYTPITCNFINRFGGWQYLTFFKANLQSIETTNKEFQLLPSNVNYNALQGQKRTFNQQGKRKVKCNTGWVDENYFELIQDLLLSEIVLLDNKPVVVKSTSSDYKTHLKDKNINYEIEFEFNYGLINDVI
jgi:hypothetical protein